MLLRGKPTVRHSAARMLSRRILFCPRQATPQLEHAPSWLDDGLDGGALDGRWLVASTGRRRVAFKLPPSLRRGAARSWAASVVTLARIARSRLVPGARLRHAAG